MTDPRVEEAETLDVDDVTISARRGKVIVRDGKGHVYREVPLHRSVRTAIRARLEARAGKVGKIESSLVLVGRI
ncbi:MAG: hypothetical protein ACRDQU_10560 [Pseudonocardiaceae bacterium]